MLSTGLATADVALRGGIPTGLTEVFGPDSCGKTTFAAALLAVARRSRRPRLLISACPLDTNWFVRCGAGARLPVLEGIDDWETVLSALSTYAPQYPGSLVVLDGATLLETVQESLDELGKTNLLERHVELRRVLDALRELALETGSYFVLINEIRAVQGTRRGTRSAHEPFAAAYTCRIELEVDSSASQYDELHHKDITLRVVKNVCVPPGGNTQMRLFIDGGFRWGHEMLVTLLASKQLRQAGAYFTDQSGRSYGPGWERAAEQLREATWQGKS